MRKLLLVFLLLLFYSGFPMITPLSVVAIDTGDQLIGRSCRNPRKSLFAALSTHGRNQGAARQVISIRAGSEATSPEDDNFPRQTQNLEDSENKEINNEERKIIKIPEI